LPPAARAGRLRNQPSSKYFRATTENFKPKETRAWGVYPRRSVFPQLGLPAGRSKPYVIAPIKAAFLAFGLSAVLALPARADDKLEPPVPVRTTAPAFPEAMRRAGKSGLVLVNCLIDVKGSVQDMKVERASDDLFVQPAMLALSKWRFKPAQLGGNKVATRVSIPIRFTFEE
jgi:TonB family protein